MKDIAEGGGFPRPILLTIKPCANAMRRPTILFDLDGTLSDPLTGIAASINYSLTVHGWSTLPEAELARYIGPPIDSVFRSLLGSAAPDLIDSCIRAYRHRYSIVGYSENQLYEGIEEMLQAITDLHVTMGICTSKRPDFAVKILEMFALHKYFDFIDGGDVGISKTEQIAGLLKNRKIDTRTIMIGDRNVDILAARENGLQSIGVLWGHGSESELTGCNPDYLARSPADIPRIIGRLFTAAGTEGHTAQFLGKKQIAIAKGPQRR